MLKKMGNQNTTAITEEEKAGNEAPDQNSSNENTIEENHVEDDQSISGAAMQESNDPGENLTLDHIEPRDGDIEGRGVNSLEPISNENQASNLKDDIDDDDVQDQEIKDTILDTTTEVLHDKDALATMDEKADDHALEKINEDFSLYVSEERTRTSTSIDVSTIQGIEEEIGHPMGEKMSETEEEKVINAMDFVEVNEGDTSSNVEEVVLDSKEILHVESLEALITDDENISLTRHQEIDENEIANQMSCNDEEFGDQIEVVKAVMATSSHVDSYDNDDTNNLVSLLNSDDDETEKFYEFSGKLEEEKNPDSDHVADFKDLEIVDTNNQEDFHELVGKSEEEKDAGNAADFKDLEVVDANSAQFHQPRSKTNSIDLATAETNTRSQIEKSPSFNFEFINLVSRNEESDQTPMLYHKKAAPMRSLSSPVNARFSTSLTGTENGSDESAEERTINTVDYEDQKPRSPLNGFFNDQEEESIENRKELCNGHEIEAPLRQGSKRNKSSRVSGSYFFSSCICCSGVQELGDP